MPGSYWIDVAGGVVYSRAWGALTDAEVAAHAQTLRMDPRFDPGFRQIVDFRELTDIRLSGAGVRELARHNPFRQDARRGFVVASDEAFGLTRMFGMFSNSSADAFAIFRALEPAFEWIGMEGTSPWPAGPPDATFSVP